MRSPAYSLPLYNNDFPVVQDSFPDKEHTVDDACLASLYLEIPSKCLCQVACVDSSVSGDILVNLQPLLVIGSEIPAQLIAFMNKLFQLRIHPGYLSFVDYLDGDSLCLIPFRRLHKASSPLDQGCPTF